MDINLLAGEKVWPIFVYVDKRGCSVDPKRRQQLHMWAKKILSKVVGSRGCRALSSLIKVTALELLVQDQNIPLQYIHFICSQSAACNRSLARTQTNKSEIQIVTDICR